MTAVTTVFFDVGGVLLNNGWDRHARRATVDQFNLDWDEFRDRHDFVAHDFETGRIDIDEYLGRTVFYRDRQFSRDVFIAAMKARSKALPGSLEVVEDRVLNLVRALDEGLHGVRFETAAQLRSPLVERGLLSSG